MKATGGGLARTTAVLGAALALAGAAVGPAAAQPPPEMTEVGLERGRALYQAYCGRCHGMLGEGGEGPSLARPALPRAPDHETMLAVLRGGLPGTGMPGTRANLLPDLEANLVAAYALSLGDLEEVELAGDAARGGALFAGAGECLSCHIVDGRGVGIGPELSGVGARRGADYLYASLRAPEADLPVSTRAILRGFREYLPVRAVTRDGRAVTGMRLNEDAFSIQLRSITGRVISLRKDELQSLEKRFDHSLMPSAENMTETDIDDLVAYLAGLEGGS